MGRRLRAVYKMFRFKRPNSSPEISPRLSYRDLFIFYAGFLQRHWIIMAVSLAAVLAIATIYLIAAEPRFTATATVIIEPKRTVARKGSPMVGEVTLETMMLESQVELLRTDQLLLNVIRSLGLEQDAELISSWAARSSELKLSVLQALGLRERKDPINRIERLALIGFKDAVAVRRVGLSYLITISYRSLTPAKAARVANAVATGFIASQVEAQALAARRSSEWLEKRVGELAGESARAGRAVAEFRASNNLVSSGGRLLSEQQVVEINSQMAVANSKTAELRARHDRIQEIIASGTGDGGAVDFLASNLVTRLREDEIELGRREADLAGRLGQGHQAVREIGKRREEVARLIVAELKRVAEGVRSEYEIAHANAESLNLRLQRAIMQSQTDSRLQVTLNSLEDRAQSFRLLYEGFLQRYTEAIQQQSFSLTDARIVSPASPPINKSSPQTVLVIAFALAAGFAAGTGLGALRDMQDRGVRGRMDLEVELGLAHLTSIPPSDLATENSVASSFGRCDTPNHRELREFENPVWHCLVKPRSDFAEAFRVLQYALGASQPNEKTTVVGIVSCRRGEGRSTIAANLAQTSAQQGCRVLLIDADLCAPALSALVAPGAQVGLKEVLGGKASFEEALWHHSSSNLAFLPSLRGNGEISVDSELGSPAFARFLSAASNSYDLVVIDLGPLAHVADTLAAANAMMNYILVTAHGTVSLRSLQDHLAEVPAVRSRSLGGVINRFPG